MKILEVHGDRWAYRELLLLADPSEDMVKRYLPLGFMLIAQEGEETIGEIVAVPVEDGFEIKNLAVAPGRQRQGIGTALVHAALSSLPANALVWVGTGNFPSTLRFYNQCGFTSARTLKNFFIDNYPEPIYEDGTQCIDMIYLKRRTGAATAFRTEIPGYRLRFAGEDDIPLILSFIRELADYEHMAELVVATEELLREWLFVQKKAEVLLGEWMGEPVGFALFFHNFSTFLGRSGLYLEDLYIRPEARGKGLGKALLRQLARLARDRGCGRMEWWCLDWNEPSIAFYKSLGAEPMEDWTVYRLTEDTLSALADS